MTVHYTDNRCELASGSDPWADEEISLVTPETIVNQEIPVLTQGSGFSMARLSENPQILALEFTDNMSMRYSLARIATYVEILSKTRIPTLEESPRGVGYDLRLSDVVDFYNTCATDHVTLSPHEKELLDQLVAQGLLATVAIEEGLWVYTQSSSPHVLIAIDPNLGSYDRKVTFIHEYSHALYFLDEDFRSQVSEAFSSLDPDTQRFLYGAMIASGYYESGETWLIETETQAHAIEPQEGDHGFLNLMLAAEENCSPQDLPFLVQSSFACEDFWSYPGDLRGLMTNLNDHYTAISLGRIPLLLSKEEKKQNFERFKSSLLNDPRLSELSKVISEKLIKDRRIWSPSSSTVERAAAELDRLQARFDKSHEGGSSEDTSEPVCVADPFSVPL